MKNPNIPSRHAIEPIKKTKQIHYHQILKKTLQQAWASTINQDIKQIHHGNPLLEAATRTKKEIHASMSLDDAERKGIAQLEHHMKATMKSCKPSSTDGASGTSKEPANNRERVPPTKQDKKKGG